MPDEKTSGLADDSQIRHYRIISKIGAGGMGEVYLAKDTKLDRKVAVKFLNDEFSKDTDKLNRFVQEAKATSALNHPNILTVHEIGEVDGKQYIATEFIEGETLRQLLTKKESVPLTQILKIGIQVSEALAAAHKAGIIHRDIKPENIMIRDDGYIKVLDFGLAKLTEKTKAEADISLEGDTKALVKTNPGMVMGTVSYMSPEQARGKMTDARTDIWSLGVVVYEMLEGKVPFTGETINHTIVSILEKEPKLLANVPDELQRIIRKTLTKDKEMRYQSTKDLLIDLKNLRRDLDIQGELERSVVPNRDVINQVQENATQIYSEKSIEDTKAESGANATQNVTNSSSLEYAVTQARTHKIATVIVGIVLLSIISTITYLGYFAFRGELFSKKTPFAKIRSEELFTAEKVNSYRLSADGKLMAYSKIVLKDNKSYRSMIVRQIQTGSENVIREIDNEKGNLWVVDFSPDGEYIYYGENIFGSKANLYRIPTFGGSAQKILSEVLDIHLSLDGKKIAYRKTNDSGNWADFYQSDINGNNQEEILRADDIGAENTFLGDWSPDGTKLAIYFDTPNINDGSGTTASPQFIAVFDLSNQDRPRKDRLQIINNRLWGSAPNGIHWDSDGKALITTVAKMETPNKFDIFYLSYPGGEVRQLTDDAQNYVFTQLSADGKTLIARTNIGLTSLWSVDPKTKSAKRLTSDDKSSDPSFLSASNDGRLYFTKAEKNGTDIYSMREDGSDQQKLFSYPLTLNDFRVAPDGKYFVLSVFPVDEVGSKLHRIDLDGSNDVQLTDVKRTSQFYVTVTSSGEIWFTRQPAGFSNIGAKLMRMPIAGGTAEEIRGLEPSIHAYQPVTSPNGKYLAYSATVKNEQTGKNEVLFRIVELNNGVAGKKIMELTRTFNSRIRWTPASDAVIYEKETGRHDLFKMDLATQKETQISEFDSDIDTVDFLWSQDGQHILVFKNSTMFSFVRIEDAGQGN